MVICFSFVTYVESKNILVESMCWSKVAYLIVDTQEGEIEIERKREKKKKWRGEGEGRK
jgi:hypothetical protein